MWPLLITLPSFTITEPKGPPWPKFYEKDNKIYADVVANESSLIYWCLQYGEVIEIIEPKTCRDKIRDIVTEMFKRYN